MRLEIAVRYDIYFLVGKVDIYMNDGALKV